MFVQEKIGLMKPRKLLVKNITIIPIITSHTWYIWWQCWSPDAEYTMSELDEFLGHSGSNFFIFLGSVAIRCSYNKQFIPAAANHICSWCYCSVSFTESRQIRQVGGKQWCKVTIILSAVKNEKKILEACAQVGQTCCGYLLDSYFNLDTSKIESPKYICPPSYR